MKTNDMFKRVENLSEKLRDTTTDGYLHVDFDYLSEAEKGRFANVMNWNWNTLKLATKKS